MFCPSLISFIIGLITVSYQAIKAALANPVDSLHYELKHIEKTYWKKWDGGREPRIEPLLKKRGLQ